MPQEIDDLHLTLLNLKRNVALLPRDVDFDIDITFCLSEELTDWENTKLPMEYFSEKFQSLLPLMDWSKNPRGRVELGSEVLGCVSQRRWSLERNKDYDFTVWLDTDIFFIWVTVDHNRVVYRVTDHTAYPRVTYDLV